MTAKIQREGAGPQLHGQALRMHVVAAPPRAKQGLDEESLFPSFRQLPVPREEGNLEGKVVARGGAQEGHSTRPAIRRTRVSTPSYRQER